MTGRLRTVAVHPTAEAWAPPQLAASVRPLIVVTGQVYAPNGQLEIPPVRSRYSHWHQGFGLELGFILAAVRGWQTLRRSRHRAKSRGVGG